MPNICSYSMRIKGSKEAIKRIMGCLTGDYDYEEGAEKPAHKHFFRVFDAEQIKEPKKVDGEKYVVTIWGTCAWSVYSCMCSGEHTYYNDQMHNPNFNGTTLEEQSKDCEIEVFSEETGNGFSEHYIYKYGECIKDDCIDIVEGGYDEDGNPTTDIDWDEYDGDYITFNDHQDGIEGDWLWEI